MRKTQKSPPRGKVLALGLATLCQLAHASQKPVEKWVSTSYHFLGYKSDRSDDYFRCTAQEVQAKVDELGQDAEKVFKEYVLYFSETKTWPLDGQDNVCRGKELRRKLRPLTWSELLESLEKVKKVEALERAAREVPLQQFLVGILHGPNAGNVVTWHSLTAQQVQTEMNLIKEDTYSNYMVYFSKDRTWPRDAFELLSAEDDNPKYVSDRDGQKVLGKLTPLTWSGLKAILKSEVGDGRRRLQTDRTLKPIERLELLCQANEAEATE